MTDSMAMMGRTDDLHNDAAQGVGAAAKLKANEISFEVDDQDGAQWPDGLANRAR